MDRIKTIINFFRTRKNCHCSDLLAVCWSAAMVSYIYFISIGNFPFKVQARRLKPCVIFKVVRYFCWHADSFTTMND